MLELKKWEPFRDIASIQKEIQKNMDDFFRRVFGSFGGLPPVFLRRGEMKSEWYPAIDVYTKNNQFVIHADLPGVDPKDVDISITGNIITIKGEKKAEIDEKKEGYIFHETSYGAFERSMILPEGVDTSTVHATYRNGILEVTMPAKAEALPKKVKVEIEEVKKAA